MRRRLATAVAAIAMLAVSAPGTASAATEFGDTCAGDRIAPGSYTLTTLAAPPSPLSLTAPVGGVITKVKMQVQPFSGTVSTSVKLLRPTGGTSFLVVNETTISATSGLTVADARMPVAIGDRLGLYGFSANFEGEPPKSVSFYCDVAGSRLGASPGDATAGSSVAFIEPADGRVPLAAIIEPDADNDGYGDETQDGCPQSAAFHGPCPLVTLDAVNKPGRRSVAVLVATSFQAPVQVTGTANLGKGKKATLKAAVQTVPAGKLVRFTLKFPKALKNRLKELESSKKLTLKIAASATNVAGQVSTDTSKAKLKGQA